MISDEAWGELESLVRVAPNAEANYRPEPLTPAEAAEAHAAGLASRGIEPDGDGVVCIYCHTRWPAGYADVPYAHFASPQYNADTGEVSWAPGECDNTIGPDVRQ